MKSAPDGRLPLLRLGLLTVAAVAIHGYHLGVEDGEIYIPAAKKLLHPELYPFAPEFFQSHGHLSLFSPLLAATARVTHLSMDWTIFGWYVASLLGMLVACWLLAAACFKTSRARWGAVLLVTAVLSMPAANTALLLMDPYLTARSFSTPLTLFALAAFLERKYVWMGVALVGTALVHPQMVVYLVFLTGVIWLVERNRTEMRQSQPVMAAVSWISWAGLLPTGFHLAPATEPYREALYSRDYFFLSNWAWYHWLGMLGPLAILAWFWRGKLRGTRDGFARISFAMIPFGLLSIVVGLVFSSSHAFDMFARLQPLRSFHLITLVFMLLLGGVIAEYVGGAEDAPGNRWRRWAMGLVVVPVAAGMFVVGRATYPNSPQVEWPGATSANAWVNTLLWVRGNTPEQAVFAVDSRYFKDAATDVHGFRAVSERSALADYYKDGGVVSLFPALAVEWKQMSNATYGLNDFTVDDFRRLRAAYPMVSWTVVHGNAPAGMACPYQEQGYAVCQMPTATETDIRASGE